MASTSSLSEADRLHTLYKIPSATGQHLMEADGAPKVSGAPGTARQRSGRGNNPGAGAKRRLLRAGSRFTLVPDYTQQHDHGLRRSRTAKAYYMLEELFTRPRGKTFGLVFFAVIQVVLGAVLLTFGDLGDNEGTNFMESLWESWTYVADPGTHADEGSWLRRVMSFFITVGGMLFFAIVVGFVVDAIRARMEELKRGKSAVVETGHYLILGWTDKSFSLIRELCLAMESEGGGVIVILSERDKDEIEGEITEHFTTSALCGTTVVCRTGSALLVGDLNKVAASVARSIIILADAGQPDKADARTLRTVLSLIGMKQPPLGHVVAELRDIDNEGLVQIVGKGLVETIVSHDIIGRLMIKCARQKGLADAYEMFLGFEGDEFYLSTWSELTGKKFGDLFRYFPDAIPVGIKTADGKLIINPLEDATILSTDEILFLAEDDDMYTPVFPPIEVTGDPNPPSSQRSTRTPECILMCGWRRDICDVIDLLDTMVVRGSELHLMNEVSVIDRMNRFQESGLEVRALGGVGVRMES